MYKSYATKFVATPKRMQHTCIRVCVCAILQHFRALCLCLMCTFPFQCTISIKWTARKLPQLKSLTPWQVYRRRSVNCISQFGSHPNSQLSFDKSLAWLYSFWGQNLAAVGSHFVALIKSKLLLSFHSLEFVFSFFFA